MRVEESAVLAITLLGFKFSGTDALIAAVVVVVLVAAGWYLLARRRKVK
jgi:hypothetical protein